MTRAFFDFNKSITTESSGTATRTRIPCARVHYSPGTGCSLRVPPVSESVESVAERKYAYARVAKQI